MNEPIKNVNTTTVMGVLISVVGILSMIIYNFTDNRIDMLQDAVTANAKAIAAMPVYVQNSLQMSEGRTATELRQMRVDWNARLDLIATKLDALQFRQAER